MIVKNKQIFIGKNTKKYIVYNGLFSGSSINNIDLKRDFGDKDQYDVYYNYYSKAELP